MISSKNIEIINKLDSSLVESLKELDSGNFLETSIEESKSGIPSLKIKKNDKEYYLSSKYDPLREAKTLIDEFEYDKEQAAIFFYGAGLGYHIKEFLKRNPDIHFFIFEPNLEILYRFLENFEIADYPANRFIGISNDNKVLKNAISYMYDNFGTKYLYFYLPSHTKVLEEEFDDFLNTYKKSNMEKTSTYIAMLRFQERNIVCQIKNFGTVLRSPNILDFKNDAFKDKIALLVAAGPSLEDEYENLREIKEKNIAYIFAVGSTVNSLMKQNITPDAIFAYESGKGYYNVVKHIIENKIKNIPFVFGASVGFEAVVNYTGKTCFMDVRDDILTRDFLNGVPVNYDFKEKNTIACGRTISIPALDTMIRMGFSKIYLVGQNFGSRGNLRYARGIEYESAEKTDKDKHAITYTVKDVYGNPIETKVDYVLMKEDMEYLIEHHKASHIINTTKGGANIEGTVFKKLEEEMKTMKENNAPAFTDFLNPPIWNEEQMKKNVERFDSEKSKIESIIEDYKNVLNKIQKKIDKHEFKRIEKDYADLDDCLKRIEKNNWSLRFPLPSILNIYEKTANKIYMMNLEKNERKKAKNIHEEFSNFLKAYEEEVKRYKPLYEELKGTINKYFEEIKN
ncbi:MAG: motility associated factor glycosyltransferase family protein [Tissierellia bacterium]|nr:motility associated factor glycosyltransferase family protein [Tissierellia bacterium]